MPLSDWNETADSDNQSFLVARTVAGRPVAATAALERLAERLNAARNPVLVLGPDVDVCGGWDAAVALAEQVALPVLLGSFEYGRIGFPTDHPCYQGTLGLSVEQIHDQLAPYDFIAWIGGAVLPYHAWTPGPYLKPGTELIAVTADPDQAARSPVGDAVVGDPADALARLAKLVDSGKRPMPQPLSKPVGQPGSALANTRLKQVLAQLRPDDASWIYEAPSLGSWWDMVPINQPNSYFYAAASGLGYGLPAAVGVALAQPGRRVVALIGDGSANYSITGLWSAAQQHLDITYVIVRNGIYQVLADFGSFLNAPELPGLTLPGINFVSIAKGYGVPAVAVTDPHGLASALKHSFADRGPSLIQVDVVPEESDLFA
ncbi:thiamine pyrophosphate-dependent enzyme [Nocardia sp. CA-128927]|uniref:thiamine pyrophosphate-dependent enzyme n=1 Tax=Nocardia sp. CA-128927 TaxID=3239975 RepID=UPI003D987BB7